MLTNSCQVRMSTMGSARKLSGKNFLLTMVAFGVLAFSSMSSSFVNASANATANATDNSTDTGSTTSAAPGLCVNVTTVTPTNVTSTVTNSTDNSTSQVTAVQNVTTTECVLCENVTTEKNVTVTSVNATDNSTTTATSLQNVTECVPIPEPTPAPVVDPVVDPTPSSSSSAAPTTDNTNTNTTKIEGKLDLTMTVPAGTTVADLNADATFKGALASSIKAALNLGATATVVIKEIKAGAAARLLRAAFLRSLNAANRRLGDSLKLDVKYEITLPEAEASAVFTKIADTETFATAVKTKSVAELSTAGLTGYTVDAVVATAATGDLAPAPVAPVTPTTDDDDEVGSGAFSNLSSGSLSTAILLVGSVFSMKLASA